MLNSKFYNWIYYICHSTKYLEEAPCFAPLSCLYGIYQGFGLYISLRFNVIYCGYYFELINMKFMYFHAFTNISLALFWMINGAIILGHIQSENAMKAALIDLTTKICAVVTTLICLTDALWYILGIKDHVEKEHMTSVVFLAVNLVLSAAFIMIVSTFRQTFSGDSKEVNLTGELKKINE